MLWRRKCVLSDLAYVGCSSGRGVIPEIREWLREARRARLTKAEHVMHHEHLAIAIGAGADSYRRHVDAVRYFATQRRRHALDHDRERTCRFECGRIFEQPFAASGRAT